MKTEANQHGELEFDQIMVQITFAFVIILGYLVSRGVDEAKQLAAETHRYKQRTSVSETMLQELERTELGMAELGRVKAEKATQLEKLLRIWAQQRKDRRLFRLLQQFGNARLIPLADDFESLPVGDDFEVLKQESKRVFLASDKKVNSRVVLKLMKEVLAGAGFDLKKLPASVDPDLLPPHVAALYYDDGFPTLENLRILKQQVEADLGEEREMLSGLQYSLAGRICIVRREKLAELPIAEDSAAGTDRARLGAMMLDGVLKELKEQMDLLPEAEQRIRQGGNVHRTRRPRDQKMYGQAASRTAPLCHGESTERVALLGVGTMVHPNTTPTTPSSDAVRWRPSTACGCGCIDSHNRTVRNRKQCHPLHPTCTMKVALSN